jgi:hypothetical protein
VAGRLCLEGCLHRSLVVVVRARKGRGIQRCRRKSSVGTVGGKKACVCACERERKQEKSITGHSLDHTKLTTDRQRATLLNPSSDLRPASGGRIQSKAAAASSGPFAGSERTKTFAGAQVLVT